MVKTVWAGSAYVSGLITLTAGGRDEQGICYRSVIVLEDARKENIDRMIGLERTKPIYVGIVPIHGWRWNENEPVEVGLDHGELMVRHGEQLTLGVGLAPHPIHHGTSQIQYSQISAARERGSDLPTFLVKRWRLARLPRDTDCGSCST
jgi:hypothetical protein